MGVAKKDDDAKKVETVQVPFAYASRPNGEVVQLVKGDVVDDSSFTKASVAHLRDIGFIA